MPSATFDGLREGYFFTTGCRGLGYYLDPAHSDYPKRQAELEEDGGGAPLVPPVPDAGTGSDQPCGFEAALRFEGARAGRFFARGCSGLGYYLDPRTPQYGELLEEARHSQLTAGQPNASGSPRPTTDTDLDTGRGTGVAPVGTDHTQRELGEPLSGGGGKQMVEQAEEDSDNCEERPRHYWAQALQYLERGVQVQAGKKVSLLAKRDGAKISFSLKEGVGNWVGKSPWLIEWGGGASVESPHFQRVHYCQLLVSDFLMRLKCKRFPPIEKDMKMILAHCGSLFLDPQVLADVYHEFVILELVHGRPEFSPGASLEAFTKRALTVC
ncbi:hypothetical protein CYMTET_31413 [Cymbomonas tetramitiformis]|uniref:Uncharacterized protein n=2 Tax=Cymbomonas tetramitiformis TaxID=36881 RepID=A0AAE0FGV0_9CHLO|nr:hypothetical protein CYMTET_31413 [Cymbomonas tetramitiformis]